MSKLTTAIKRAAVALQLTAMGHENPSPVEGTEAAKVLPSDHDETREAKNNAVKVVTQLREHADGEELDAETKAEISASILAAGPPANAILQNKLTGELRNFDGTPALDPEPGKVYVVKVNTDTGKVTGETLAPVKRESDGKPTRKRDREGYMRYKNGRHPKQ